MLETNNLDSGKNKAFMFRYMFLALMVTEITFKMRADARLYYTKCHEEEWI